MGPHEQGLCMFVSDSFGCRTLLLVVAEIGAVRIAGVPCVVIVCHPWGGGE